MSTPPADGVTLRQATRVWWLVGLNSFGGPGAQIPMMHRMLVEERRWISERRFLHGVNFTMVLPGPEAQQLATYIGWLLHGIKGGLVAGGLFILPGFISILGLSILYVTLGDTDAVFALFYGIKPAVVAIVVTAVVRLGRRAVQGPALVATSVLGFVMLFFLDIPFPLIVVAAGAVGFVGGRLWPARFVVDGADSPDGAALVADGVVGRPGRGRTLRVLGIGVLLWLLPVAVAAGVFGTESVWFDLGSFFAVAAVVTFGGAYAVLGFVAQQAVQAYGWLLPGEMVDGLGMAETTPGPAIQVVQFVGFLGAYRLAGGSEALTAAVVAALLVTWVTFVPCFIWIFAGAAHVDRLRDRPGLSSALSAITAAVVGVIANLAVWFALHTLFESVDERLVGPIRLLTPQWSSLDIPALVLSILALVALARLHWPMLRVIAVCALAGGAVHLMTLP